MLYQLQPNGKFTGCSCDRCQARKQIEWERENHMSNCTLTHEAIQKAAKTSTQAMKALKALCPDAFPPTMKPGDIVRFGTSATSLKYFVTGNYDQTQELIRLLQSEGKNGGPSGTTTTLVYLNGERGLRTSYVFSDNPNVVPVTNLKQ